MVYQYNTQNYLLFSHLQKGNGIIHQLRDIICNNLHQQCLIYNREREIKMKHNQASKHNHTFANFALPMMVNRNSNSCTRSSTCIRNQSFELIQNNQFGMKTKCITCNGLTCSWGLTQAARSQFHFNFSLFIF